MRTSKTISGLFVLIALFAVNGLVTVVSAQKKEKCAAVADQIYFVDSGQSVAEVYPGSNGGNGYQLNILGTGADNFEVVQESYMTSLYLIPNYTSSTSAKWGMTFAANAGRMISTVRLRNKCTGKTGEYKLTARVKLLDQEPGKCTALANQIYFVDSGQTVTEVRPGSNGGNGYQLNILGTGVDNFEVVQARYMTSLGAIPNYTNSTSAKWGMTFAANMGHTISGIKMRNKCTGEVREHKLLTSIKLLDQ